MNPLRQSGFLFSNFKAKSQTPFEKLFEIFKELITYTSRIMSYVSMSNKYSIKVFISIF